MVGRRGEPRGGQLREIATALSRRGVNFPADDASRAAKPARARHLATMARASLGMALFAMCAASCIVTTIPELEEEERTAPELVVHTASPDPREIQFITAPDDRLTFSAQVRSENDLGSPILVRLLIDYGVPDVYGNPWQGQLQGGDVPEATADEPRAASVEFIPSTLSPGCHTITLMVSHAFANSIPQCPVDLADSDQITWTIFRCESSFCADESIDNLSCPKAEQECPDPADGGEPR